MSRILIVDDEPRVDNLLSLKLKMSGFNVSSTDNGIKALELAREIKPALILMNLMMPGGDGIEVYWE